MKKDKIYALYHGDKFIDLGTAEYLAKLIGVDIKTIKYYSYESYRKRLKGKKACYITIRIEDEDEK